MRFILFVLMSSMLYAGTGNIQGIVLDKTSMKSISGARILCADKHAVSGKDGSFVLNNVNPGTYPVKISSIGYNSLIIHDIAIYPGRIVQLQILLEIKEILVNDIDISAAYYSMPSAVQQSMNAEQIRRSPGSGGDFARAMTINPALNRVNDMKNGFIIRGGAPSENSWYIQGIPVPEISHFPSQNGGGGAISMIPVDLISGVQLMPGNAGAEFGNNMSGTTQINLRKGSAAHFHAQADINLAGLGIIAEAPLANEKASFILSARRSYLDLLINSFSAGTGIAPVYHDIQFLTQWQADKDLEFSMLFVGAGDKAATTNELTKEYQMSTFGNQNIDQYTIDMSMKNTGLWGYSLTSFSFSGQYFTENYFEAGTALHLLKNNSSEQSITLRSVQNYILNENQYLVSGGELMYAFPNYDYSWPVVRDMQGAIKNGYGFQSTLQDFTAGVWTSWNNENERFAVNIGLRAEYNKDLKLNILPRLNVKWKFNDKFSLAANIGIYSHFCIGRIYTHRRIIYGFKFIFKGI